MWHSTHCTFLQGRHVFHVWHSTHCISCRQDIYVFHNYVMFHPLHFLQARNTWFPYVTFHPLHFPAGKTCFPYIPPMISICDIPPTAFPAGKKYMISICDIPPTAFPAGKKYMISICDISPTAFPVGKTCMFSICDVWPTALSCMQDIKRCFPYVTFHPLHFLHAKTYMCFPYVTLSECGRFSEAWLSCGDWQPPCRDSKFPTETLSCYWEKIKKKDVWEAGAGLCMFACQWMCGRDVHLSIQNTLTNMKMKHAMTLNSQANFIQSILLECPVWVYSEMFEWNLLQTWTKLLSKTEFAKYFFWHSVSLCNLYSTAEKCT